MAFTIKPYSTVGYNIASQEEVEGIGSVERVFEGSGGTYDVTWSNAANYKNLAFGVNTGFLLGTTTERRFVQFPNNGFIEETLIEEINNHRGFVWRAGLLYTHYLSKREVVDDKVTPERRLVFGLHGNSRTNLSSDQTSFSGVIDAVLSADNFVRDTFSFSRQEGLEGKLPSEFGAGITYYSDQKFAIGVNFTNTNWSAFESPVVNEELNDARELSIGGFYRPNYNSVNNYFSRVHYRFGAYYKQVPTSVEFNNGRIVDDIGVTFGFSLPFFYQRKISHAHLGAAIGLRGRDTEIEERYVRLTFSFTFNDDEWFIKRKYN